jgi:hypothetical protein
MVGWQTMDTGESWLDGLDWTSVEVGQHASRKAGTGSLSNSLDGFLLPAEEIVAEVCIWSFLMNILSILSNRFNFDENLGQACVHEIV